VECGNAAYHGSRSSRDRNRLIQQVLEGLGWRLHRIWPADRFRDPGSQIARLREVLDARRRETRAQPLERAYREAAKASKQAMAAEAAAPGGAAVPSVCIPIGTQGDAPAGDEHWTDAPAME